MEDSEPLFDDAPDESPAPAHAVSAYGRGLDLLVRREHTRAELRHKLQKRGYHNGEIETALERLIEDGYLSDSRFAELFAEQRATKGYGPLRVKADLLSRGVESGQADRAIDNLELDWAEIALGALASRFLPTDDYVRMRRLLERRGFSASVAREAIGQLRAS